MMGQCKLSVMFILQTGSLVNGLCEFMFIPQGMLGLDFLAVHALDVLRVH